MWRNLVRRGVAVLVLALVLGLAMPQPAAAEGWEGWDTVWSWLANVWSAEEDQGAGLDPHGITAGEDPEAGPAPNTTISDRDQGAGLDPHG